MQKSIYQQEKDLLEKLKGSYPEDLQCQLVEDGLCWADISTEIPTAQNDFWPENLWINSQRRVLFLLKDSNNNPGEDYKDWHWGEKKETFGNVLSSWLYALKTVDQHNLPLDSDFPTRQTIFSRYPFAIVNVKKLSGTSKADWCEIWNAAQRDRKYLIRQIREILKPNIIVCCGSNDSKNECRKILTIAKEIIYWDLKDKFVEENGYCHYNKEHDILLIDSYHPSYPCKRIQMIDNMTKAVQNFMIKEDITYQIDKFLYS